MRPWLTAGVLASVVVNMLATPRLGGQATQPSDQKAPTFAVASVKANTSGERGSWSQNMLPDGYAVTNQPLRGLISLAYGVPLFKLSGGPDWVSTDRFDVDAKSDHRIMGDEKLAMLRTLLEERFKLKVHRETHEGRIYALVMARADRKSGPNLLPTTLDCGAIVAARQRREPLASVPARRDALPPCTASTSPIRFRASVIQIRSFAGWLGMAIRETVVDQTGLGGWFDIDLTVSQEPAPKVPPDALTAASATSIGPALEEQLGLKLEPTRGPVDVLVIDHVEKLTPE
jgi:uncharacterized protein (TIGR03435 family)